jgi:hypothetical protein
LVILEGQWVQARLVLAKQPGADAHARLVPIAARVDTTVPSSAPSDGKMAAAKVFQSPNGLG